MREELIELEWGNLRLHENTKKRLTSRVIISLKKKYLYDTRREPKTLGDIILNYNFKTSSTRQPK